MSVETLTAQAASRQAEVFERQTCGFATIGTGCNICRAEQLGCVHAANKPMPTTQFFSSEKTNPDLVGTARDLA